MQEVQDALIGQLSPEDEEAVLAELEELEAQVRIAMSRQEERTFMTGECGREDQIFLVLHTQARLDDCCFALMVVQEELEISGDRGGERHCSDCNAHMALVH